MKPELVEKIKNSGLSKKKIEEELGMTYNVLSGMMSGTRITPEKWETALENYLDGMKLPITINPVLEGLKESIRDIKPAYDPNNLPFPKVRKDLEFEKESHTIIPWAKPVESYCSCEAITPLELIEQHKAFKMALNARKEAIKAPKKTVNVQDLNTEALPKGGLTDYDAVRRFKKLGF